MQKKEKRNVLHWELKNVVALGLTEGVGSIVKLGGKGLIMVPRLPQRKDHADASTQL